MRMFEEAQQRLNAYFIVSALVLLMLFPSVAYWIGQVSRAIHGEASASGWRTAAAILTSVLLFWLWGLMRLGRASLEESAQQRRNPNEPWRWRSDWVSGSLQSCAHHPLRRLALWTLLWILLSAGAVVLAVYAATHGEPLGWFLLVMPLIGAGLTLHCIRRIRPFLQVGLVTAELSNTLPIGPGELLQVSFAQPQRRLDAARIELCERFFGDTQTVRKVRWTRVIADEEWREDDGVVTLSARLAGDQPGTQKRAGRDERELTWSLKLFAQNELLAEFVLPVFDRAVFDRTEP